MSRARWLVLLSRWRIDVASIGVVPCLLLAQPTPASLCVGIPLALMGVGIRIWARGHLIRGDLTSTGPYAHVRHPLYVGSFLMALGFALATGHWILVALVPLVFVAMYWPKALREEAYLRERYGADWDRYAAAVPSVFPSLLPRRAGLAPTRTFSWRRVLRHREYKTWIGVGAVAAVLWAIAR